MGRQMSHSKRTESGIVVDIVIAVLLAFYASWDFISLMSSNLVDDSSCLVLLVTAAINLLAVWLALRKHSLVYTAISYFNVIFFTLAPMEQLRLRFDPIYGNTEILRSALVMVIGWSLICLLFIAKAKSVSGEGLNGGAASGGASDGGKPNLAPLWLAATFASISGILIYGPQLFSSREIASKLIGEKFEFSVGLILTGTIFPFAFYGSILGLWLASSRGRTAWRGPFFFSSGLAVLLNNFTIISRYQVAVLLFFAVFLWTGPARWSARAVFVALLAGTLASPLFHVFRSTYAEVSDLNFESFFSTMDYDAFSMLCHTIFYVDRFGPVWGSNILSGVLFFVPRAIWIEKLQTTPFYLMGSLGTYRGLWSYNLSEPLIAEGYFGFGAFGAFLISLVFLTLADRLECAVPSAASPIYLFRFAAPIILLMVLRGSLIVGMSIIVGHLVAISLAVVLTRIGSRGSKRRSHVAVPAE
jgi:hypothetical protein